MNNPESDAENSMPGRPTPEQQAWQAATGKPWYMMPRCPYFLPRQIGATAPCDPTIFAVDHRDTGDTVLEASPADFNEPLRRVSDPNFVSQLELLMEAGLRVQI